MYINGHKCEKCLIQKDDFYGCRHEHDIIVIPENNAIKTVPLDLSQMCARYCERNEQKRANCLQYFMELLKLHIPIFADIEKSGSYIPIFLNCLYS